MVCSDVELLSYAFLAADRSVAKTLNSYSAKYRIGSDFFLDIAAHLQIFILAKRISCGM